MHLLSDMKNQVLLTESESKDLELLTEEFNTRGGMSTKELIIRLNAVPFEEFQKGLKEKIQNYKV